MEKEVLCVAGNIKVCKRRSWKAKWTFTSSQQSGHTLTMIIHYFHAIVRDQSYEWTQRELSGEQKSDSFFYVWCFRIKLLLSILEKETISGGHLTKVSRGHQSNDVQDVENMYKVGNIKTNPEWEGVQTDWWCMSQPGGPRSNPTIAVVTRNHHSRISACPGEEQ